MHKHVPHTHAQEVPVTSFCSLTTGYSVKPGFFRKSCFTVLGYIWIGIEFLIEPVGSTGLLQFLKQWKETMLQSKICNR